MKRKKHVLLFFTLLFSYTLHASDKNSPMTFEQMMSWERIREQVISDDGEWIACKMEPWKGDSRVAVYNKRGEKVHEVIAGSKLKFSPASAYLLLTQSPLVGIVEELKLKKTKKEEMPSEKLLIYDLKKNNIEEIDSIKNYKLSETADWLAYQLISKNDSTLYIRSCSGKEGMVVTNVSQYGFAKKEALVYYLTSEKEESKEETVNKLAVFIPGKGSYSIYEGQGTFGKITCSEKGDKIAFTYTEKGEQPANHSIYLSEGYNPAILIATSTDPAIPGGWIISSQSELSFSQNGERLYFGIAPRPLEKDTTILEENRPHVQIWKWDEEVQYTQQTVNKKKELNRSYKAVYNLHSKQVVQLASEEIQDLILPDEEDAGLALIASSKPYGTQRMWRGKNRYDIYLINLDNGKKKQIKEGVFDQMKLSPLGTYAYWYNMTDSSWYTFNITTQQEYRLTTPENFAAWNEDHDVPDYPRPHGIAGWSKNDHSLLIYDRYDIWKFDPENKTLPVNLTVNGRREGISYRYVQLDKEEKGIDLNKEHILRGFHEAGKGSGFYNTHFSSATRPKELISGNYMLRTLIKAKDADCIVYSCETFEQYPDMYVTNSKFNKPIRFTEGYKQQEGINWGTAELVNWISLDGIKMEGVIYKPVDFDPAKKYPMIVNFYEQNSETLYNYRMPEPHRSTIDYHYYTSNGYIVFNPDIYYKEGYPGESCYNSVMPGISAILEKGYVNEKAIAAQGHSWGGYQVAYLATRTNLFAAIESGAPVVNMFSAYGGIRWETGLNRSFQYEHGQSRIGKTIWEAPLAYFENSPLFTMDKVTTPILIMHNDSDGHVPWYQGIEYFVALKRLQKPVWMLNYPGEPHWPQKLANKLDFQKRMFQFFEHFLHGKPMPKWMSEGVPAVKQDYELGYE